MKKRIEDFWTNTETDFFCKCLELLGIEYTRNDWFLDESTQMHCHRIEYTATDDEYTAMVRMFNASKDVEEVQRLATL